MVVPSTAVAICAFIGRCLCRFILDGSMKAYGVLLKRVVGSLNTSYCMIGGAFALQDAICNSISPVANMINGLSRYNVICILGGGLASTGYFCHAFMSTEMIWQPFLYSAFAGMGLGFCNVATLIFMKESFDEDSFAVAYPFSLLFDYIGIAALPLLSEHVLAVYGLQTDMIVFGCLCLLLVFVGVTVLTLSYSPEDDPETFGVTNGTACDEDNGKIAVEDGTNEISQLISPVAQRMEVEDHGLVSGHPKLLLALFISAAFGFDFASWSIFLVPFGEYVGMDSSAAVLMSTCGGVGGLLGNVYIAILFYMRVMNDVLGLIIPCFLVSVSFSATVVSDSFVAMAAFSLISGFGIGALGVASIGILIRIVCDRHFEAAAMAAYFVDGLAALLGGFITGLIVDVTGNYYVAFGVFSAVNFVVFLVTVLWWITLERSAKIGKGGHY